MVLKWQQHRLHLHSRRDQPIHSFLATAVTIYGPPLSFGAIFASDRTSRCIFPSVAGLLATLWTAVPSKQLDLLPACILNCSLTCKK
ncbi:hypothetical protein BC828DRAFT_393272 [Blastocladiella britannica]|nr:hypothetical protein BC828DRAFT_393272 [Blastocladiella britannica]